MSKKTFHAAFGGLVLVVLTFACSFSNETQIQSTPASQTRLDQEVISFRDQALNIIQELNTVEYSIRMLESSQPQSFWGYGNTRETRDAFHSDLYYDNGNRYSETIQVGDNLCVSYEDGAWQCGQQPFPTLFSTIRSILNGTSPITYSNVHITNTTTGSKLDSFNSMQCRSFFVEEEYFINETEITQRLEYCFDLVTYYPLHSLHKYTSIKDGVVEYADISEEFDFKFNIPIEEIVLPQP